MIEQYLAEWLSWLPQDIQGPAAILIIRLVLAVVYMVAGLWLSGWVSGLVRKGLSQVKEIDMSTPELLAETDQKMLASLSVGAYFKYIFMTVAGRGAGDRVPGTD